MNKKQIVSLLKYRSMIDSPDKYDLMASDILGEIAKEVCGNCKFKKHLIAEVEENGLIIRYECYCLLEKSFKANRYGCKNFKNN